MPRGYTTIYLEGGPNDGEVFEDVPLRQLPNKIQIPTSTFFASNPDGSMSIMKGELTKNWHSYAVNIYLKKDNVKHQLGTIFQWYENVMVERCKATTKQGKQCLNSVKIDNGQFCTMHLK